MFSTRYALGAILAAAILAALPGSARAGRDLPTNFLDEPDKKWREGPVRYFLTGDEDSLFKRLKSKEEPLKPSQRPNSKAK